MRNCDIKHLFLIIYLLENSCDCQRSQVTEIKNINNITYLKNYETYIDIVAVVTLH